MNGSHLGAFAHAAALWEAHAAPKPGLVDRLGNGAHTDMDYQLFRKSASAIAPFWKGQAQIGLDETPPHEALDLLRSRGLAAEEAMFTATGGVNTHKGLIFVMSLLLYGAGRCLAQGEFDASRACAFAAKAAEPCLARDLQALRRHTPKRPLTHGERLYLDHGITGVRGEAAAGFPCILDEGLPALRRHWGTGGSFDDAALLALLRIMLRCEDSNVIHRGGITFYRNQYRAHILNLLCNTVPGTPLWYTNLGAMDANFSASKISPGGAADLLSGSFFLLFCEQAAASFRERKVNCC